VAGVPGDAAAERDGVSCDAVNLTRLNPVQTTPIQTTPIRATPKLRRGGRG
jgi:hypothetical protein